MATIPAPRASTTTGPPTVRLRGNPAYQAFWLLLAALTLARLATAFPSRRI
jgi:hypothetical protein